MSSSPEIHYVRAEPTLEILLVYAVVFIVALAASKLIATLVVTMLDRRAVALARDKPRGVVSANSSEFEIGTLPRRRETLAIAYLRGRVAGVAEVLISEALTSGWLVVTADRVHLGLLPREAPQEARDLHRELELGVVTRDRLNAAAMRVSASVEPALVSELESANLFRSWSVRRVGEIVAILVAAPAIVLALRRLIEVASAAGTGDASGGLEGGLLFLALEVVGFTLIAFALARVGEETERSLSYLAWIDDTTVALREDVASGRDDRVADVMLATALRRAPEERLLSAA